MQRGRRYEEPKKAPKKVTNKFNDENFFPFEDEFSNKDMSKSERYFLFKKILNKI